MYILSGAIAAGGGGGGGAAPAAFTMTQLSAADRVYQRMTDTGGGQGKGQGTIPVTLNVVGAGTIYARCRSAADGTTILQSPWLAVASAAVANGVVAIPGVDARLGWFYLDLSGDGVTWTNGTVPVGMGRLIALTGQSLALVMFTKQLDGTTIASLGISIPANGRVLASWGGTGGAADNTASSWMTVADATVGNSRANSAGVAELLNLQIAASGVNCGVIGHAVGATAISSWLPGQANHTELARVIALAGGAFEAMWWFQGHSDAQGAALYSTYKANLATFFASMAGLSSRSFTKYLSAIPNINYVGWGIFRERMRLRKAQQDWADENGGTYLSFADIELVDGVHQTQAGAKRIARHFHRATRPEFGLAGNDSGPLVTGVTKSGVDLTLAIDMPANASGLSSIGSPATRFQVIAAGDVNAAAFALDGTTPITVGSSSITLKLASDPGNVALEVFPMGAQPAVNDGSLSVVYDNASADGDGIGVGRQLFASPAPVRTKINTPLTSASATYGAAKFGNGRIGGRLDAPYTGLMTTAFTGMTLDFWVRTGASLPGSLQVFAGQLLANWVGINGSALNYAVGASGTVRSVAGVFAVNTEYHIRSVVLPGGHTALIFVNGVLVDTFSAAQHENPSLGYVFAIGSLGGTNTYLYTGAWIDEVAIFNKPLGTANFTPPTAPWVGNEAGLIHLWHLDEASGNAADSA